MANAGRGGGGQSAYNSNVATLTGQNSSNGASIVTGKH